jgi:Lon protease-like protein
MAQGYVRAADLPQVFPVFPLGGAILLPRGQLPLNIFEPRYLNMIDDAMAGDRIIGMVQPGGGAARAPALSSIGCAGRLTGFAETSDGRYLVTLTGLCRFKLAGELPVQTPYRQIRADFSAFETDLTTVDPEAAARHDRGPLLEALKRWLERREMDVDWDAARQAPSACNRQPFRFLIANGKPLTREIASIPMGTRGFAEGFPAIVVLVGDLSAYFDERDRHVIYIDGSLAAMQFMLALETLGLASCPINWPDIEDREKRMDQVLGLAAHERPILLIAVGYADPTGGVPFSEKTPLSHLRRYL